MPLYEYRCSDCDCTIEVIQKFSDPDLEVCTECGGKVEKVLSAPAIRFKGSGWYVNDYAKGNSNGTGTSSSTGSSNGSSSSSSDSSSSSSSSSKSESKSSSSSDSKSTAKVS